jgi:hypothetical protein
MGGYYLWHGVLGHFLALRDEVGSITVAPAELARTQRLIAPDAGQNADIPRMSAATIYGCWLYPCEKLGFWGA